VTTTKLITAEDLFEVGEDGGRFELVEGVLQEKSLNGGQHGEISGIIAARIWLHAWGHRLGTVYAAGTGFYISRNPDVVLAPDVAFVHAGRLPEDRDRRKFVEVFPDLVVEVVSPSEQPGDVTNKVQRYLNAGTRLVWVVYPAQQTIAVFRADRTWDTLQGDAELDGDGVLPGFSLPLAEMFDEES